MAKATDINLQYRFLKAYYAEALKRNALNPTSELFDLTIDYYLNPSSSEFGSNELDPIAQEIRCRLHIKYLKLKPLLVVLKQQGLIECKELYFDILRFKLTNLVPAFIDNFVPVPKVVKVRKSRKNQSQLLNLS